LLAWSAAFVAQSGRDRMTRFIRVQDIVWLVLFSALAYGSSERTPIEVGLLLCLGAFQVIEPRIPYLGTDRGLIAANLLKLGLCYLLIGYSGGISSPYYLILLLPVVSAATSLNLFGAVTINVLTALSYLSMLLYVDWTRVEMDEYGLRQLELRIIFFAVLGFFTYQLAQANRAEARKTQAAAQQLAEANRSLQEAEAAVRRSERLAALGQLTAGLAHELRNPMGTIRASAEMLTRNVDQDPAITRELAGFISSEVDRTNSLITRFLEFARPMQLRLAATPLSEILDKAVEQFERHNPPYPVSVYKNYALDVPVLNVDGELLERVFYNLLLNAAQATPAGGTVTLKTRQWSGGGAEVSVIDRGSGIATEHLENIFNPFFTTKPEGVGLGLAIVSKIVDEHGGHIAVESEPSKGTIFRVFLPESQAAPEAGLLYSANR
jgi:two-component system, NtrC family, sensor histidine kinase HydH